MSTHTIRDSVDTLKETARGAYEDMKTAAQERVLDPLTEKGRHLASAARHQMDDMTDYGRRTMKRTSEWASANPWSASGIAFGAGLLAGVYLVARCRR